MQRFDGKVAIVTGAASGIGRATVVRLANEGAAVLGVDVAEEGLAETAELAGGKTEVARCDVSAESDAEAAVAKAVETFGQLDVLVNSAGTLRFGYTHECPLEDWNRVLAVNLTGTFLMCRAAIPQLLQTHGAIVNVASTAGHAGQPWASAYGASKGGILALTKGIAVEYAKQGLRCNSISPGGIDTPIRNAFTLPEGADPWLLNRVLALAPADGTADGVAAAIAWMASSEAVHLVGADILFDGGIRA